MGKTTVAISVAHDLLSEFGNAIFFVDLASINEDGLVPTAVTSVLGVRSHSPDPWPDLLAFLGRQRVLLVLDNCEHVIDAAAELAEAVVRFCPRATVLATSREALRIDAADAAELGIEEGEVVRIVSRRGSVLAPVSLDPALRPGLASITPHFSEQVDTNVITNDAWDPKSGTSEFKATAIRIEKVTEGLDREIGATRSAQPVAGQ